MKDDCYWTGRLEQRPGHPCSSATIEALRMQLQEQEAQYAATIAGLRTQLQEQADLRAQMQEQADRDAATIAGLRAQMQEQIAASACSTA